MEMVVRLKHSDRERKIDGDAKEESFGIAAGRSMAERIG